MNTKCAISAWVITTLVAIGGVVLVVLLLDDGTGSAVEFYQNKLQGQFFQALLVIGGLLLALQTFIVATMKTSVYDTDEYEAERQRQKQSGGGTTRYGPLRNLSHLLTAAIAVSLVSAVVQYSVGLISSLWAVCVSLATSVLSLALLVGCMMLIHENLRRMFNYLEQQRGEQGHS